MEKSLRIRTELGVNKQLTVDLSQEFDFIEILSLKFKPDEVYPRSCSDFGVVAGRVIANGGYGVPNAKISVFIPISEEDKNNPVISALYPYSTPDDTNENGYRYNLLPYEKQHGGHVPTGTFPSMGDVLKNPVIKEIYDKYYKLTVKTNESGDYMIFGVPLGNQTIFMDMDLSDIGMFSLNPQDLIRMGRATEDQLNGNTFKASENLDSLPQIVSQKVNISIDPFWGEENLCQSKIHRLDFDLRKLGIEITPVSIFMGSIISDSERLNVSKKCKPKTEQGDLCNLVAGPGAIIGIRQTIFVDENGLPVLEDGELERNGKIINEDGSWLTPIKMNMDFVTTNEFGETILSTDPKIGIPTSGKYRFKIKWGQSNDLNDGVKRGYYLIPNIREYWTGDYDPTTDNGPYGSPSFTPMQVASYAFSLDWGDYGTPQMIDDAVNCRDKFFLLKYNKIYTTSQVIDQYHNGAKQRFIGIKEITDKRCETENNKFPTTDGVKNVNLLFSLASFFLTVLYFLLIPIIILAHIVKIIKTIIDVILKLVYSICKFLKKFGFFKHKPCPGGNTGNDEFFVKLPMLSYPDCDVCDCGVTAPSPPSPPWVDSGNFDNDSSFSSGTLLDTSIGALSNSAVCGDLEIITVEELCALEAGRFNNDYPISFGQAQSDYSWNMPWRNTPMYIKNQNHGNDYLNQRQRIFSCSLPLAERINLFNTKAKFFENDITNFSDAPNQIKVVVEPTLNPTPDKHHFDNVYIILVPPEELEYYTKGKIVFFQKPELSNDPNPPSPSNPGVTEGIGQTGDITITVNYADPNATVSLPNQPPLQTVYNVNFSDFAERYYNYPSDIEYFQVITGMTYSSFMSKVNQSNQNGFAPEYLNFTTKLKKTSGFTAIGQFNNDYFTGDFVDDDTYHFTLPPDEENQCGDTQNMEFLRICRNETEDGCEIQPIKLIQNFSNLGIIIMTRGVDTTSPRVNINYDLSRLFGYQYGVNADLKVEGSFRLNIPIQPNLILPRHDQITDNASANNGSTLFYNSYNSDFSSSFLAYTTNMHTYYSSLDSTSIGFLVNQNYPWTELNNSDVSFGLVGELRSNTVLGINPDECYPYKMNSIGGNLYGEYIEGSALSLQTIKRTEPLISSCILADSPNTLASCQNNEKTFIYFAPKYNGSSTLLVNDPAKIVFRSDRIPTSTTMDSDVLMGGIIATQNNYPAGQQNNNFEIFFTGEDSDTPAFDAYGGAMQGSGTDGGNETASDIYGDSAKVDTLLHAMECENLVLKACYHAGGLTSLPTVEPPTADCNTRKGKKFVNNGCYVLVDIPILDIPIDLKHLTEWTARMRLSLAACMNIFSHTFVNSWVNGVLYHFTIKNNRFFKYNNTPYSMYCKDLVILDETTNNFYYRSSPYNITTGKFVGKETTDSVQDRNILYPTTLMDLGPVNDYIKDLTLTSEYEGYVADKLRPTSYQDISSLLQIFLLSRFMNNSTFLSAINVTGNSGANALFKNKRGNEKKRFDGDYAQAIQINTQFGVYEFSSEFYSDSDVFIGDYNSSSEDGGAIVGAWFDGDNQNRDFITPKRIILDETTPAMISQNIPVFTQEVPYYRWEIKIETNPPLIFGTENNDWYTIGINSSPFQAKDRTDTNQDYFRGDQSSSSGSFRGFITNVANYGTPSFSNISPIANSAPIVSEIGNPWYFYFGLKRGRTALDLFSEKYIN